MKRRFGAATAALFSLGLVSVAALAQDSDKLIINGELEMTTRAPAPEGVPFDELISGWHYRENETQAAQADDFDNPGMLYVEQGAELWSTVEGEAGKSCADCHGEASESMKDIGAQIPKWNEAAAKPFNLELQINQCRTERMKAPEYKFGAPEQVAMVTFVRHQARGKPVQIDLAAGDMQSWWDRGKELYYTRFGQLDLACANCHENAGKHIRADFLSQGQINGFPTYRFADGGMVPTHQRFKGCVRDTRAKPFEPLSDEFMALEVYLAWRGSGLSVETPAVRQ